MSDKEEEIIEEEIEEVEPPPPSFSEEELEAAKRESLKNFSDDHVIIEKYLALVVFSHKLTRDFVLENQGFICYQTLFNVVL